MGGAADEARTVGGGSRWGIKGSSEVSEGLTAVYKFETRLDEDAAQSGNQIYAGLSGGFGSLTIGKFNNAAYLSGGIRDVGNAFGDSDVSSKVGNTVSYGYSTEAFTLQADAIMDEGTDTGKAVDQVQFGLSVNLGDIGKVALAYEKKEDSMKAGMAIEDAMRNMGNSNTANLTLDSDEGIKGMDGSAWNKADGNKAIVEGKVSDVTYTYDADGSGTTNTAVEVMAIEITHNGDVNSAMIEMGTDGNYYTATCNTAEKRSAENTCETTEYVLVSKTVNAPAEDKSVGTTMYTHVAYSADGVLDATATVTPMETKHGYKRSHISAAFGLGAVTVRLGHTTEDSNDPMMTAKAKTNFLGFTGSIGDTGMDWRAFGRNKEDHKGKETSPWGIGVGKALGGGAYTYIEHQNDDDGNSGRTQIGLNVDF